MILAVPWNFARIQYSFFRIQVVQMQLRSGSFPLRIQVVHLNLHSWRFTKRHLMLHIGFLRNLKTSANALSLKGELKASIIPFPSSQPLQRWINWLSTKLVRDVTCILRKTCDQECTRTVKEGMWRSALAKTSWETSLLHMTNVVPLVGVWGLILLIGRLQIWNVLFSVCRIRCDNASHPSNFAK